MQTIPLWRGRACTVLLKEKGGREGERSHSNPLFKNFLTPHRIQISDSKLFVRGVCSKTKKENKTKEKKNTNQLD